MGLDPWSRSCAEGEADPEVSYANPALVLCTMPVATLRDRSPSSPSSSSFSFPPAFPQVPPGELERLNRSAPVASPTLGAKSYASRWRSLPGETAMASSTTRTRSLVPVSTTPSSAPPLSLCDASPPSFCATCPSSVHFRAVSHGGVWNVGLLLPRPCIMSSRLCSSCLRPRRLNGSEPDIPEGPTDTARYAFHHVQDTITRRGEIWQKATRDELLSF